MNEEPIVSAINCNNIKLVKEILDKNRSDVNLQNQSSETVLMIACLNSNLKMVKLLLNYNPDMDKKNNYSETALLYAIRNGNIDLVKLLLDNGSNIFIENYAGETPLSIACRFDRDDIIELLLNNGYNPGKVNEFGSTILMKAICNKKIDLIKKLLKYDCNIDQQDSYGNTALTLACINNSYDIVKLLLEKCADPNIKNNSSKTMVIHGTNKEEYINTINILQKCTKINLDIKNQLDQNALMIAINNKNLKIVKLLIKYDIDVDIQDKLDNTVLMKLLKEMNDFFPLSRKKKYDYSLIKDIIKRSKHLDLRNSYDETAFSLAVDVQNRDIINMLLNRRVNTDSQNKNIVKHQNIVKHHNRFIIGNYRDNFDTPLMKLIKWKWKDEIIATILNSHNLDYQDNNGNTALLLAAKERMFEIVKLLIDHRCDYKLSNNDCETIVYHIVANENEKIIQESIENSDKLINRCVEVVRRSKISWKLIKKYLNKDLRKYFYL